MNLVHNNILKKVVDLTESFILEMPKDERKSYGQFFTSLETAVFMASLFTLPDEEVIPVLDSGAGSGILSAALILRILNETDHSVQLTCYENDEKILPLLKQNLDLLKEVGSDRFEYCIRNVNYITSQRDLYNLTLNVQASVPDKFLLSISNPPYQKISKDAPEALSMPDICYGTPNLYFLFMAMNMFNLEDDGEMVCIVPRSWTSGAYFKKFREKFLQDCSLEYIHLFESRNKVFQSEKVLQETVILKARKSTLKGDTITISSTVGNQDFNAIHTISVPYNLLVSGHDSYVFLVSNQKQVEALKKLKSWRYTLPELGLKMRTGLTVDFRHKAELNETKVPGAVPLFYMSHFKDNQIIFPNGKEYEYLKTIHSGLLQPNNNYLFVKRFTTKEEKRRLQCALYFHKNYPEYSQISTHNKINFIGCDGGLDEKTLKGLYVLFNSTLYDEYYRILNGSTQVNSTEVNSMPVPDRLTIERMGADLMEMNEHSIEACDLILERYIHEG